MTSPAGHALEVIPAQTARSAARPAVLATPVRLDRVSLAHGRRMVLRDVSFTLEAGEFVGLLGPNGAGKTTLMRAMLGLVPLAGGEMLVLGGRPVRGHPAIGYMPQSRALPATIRLTGRDVVAAAVRGHRLGLAWLDAGGRREVDWALGMVSAGALADRPLGELSGGERQRLLLAQALIGRPRLLLLDEPLASLDPQHQGAVVALVRAVQRELGIAVLFSAHEVNPLLGHLDRVLYLGGGHAAIGTVEEVITGPVLSGLYGAPIEVLQARGRIFVVAGDA